MRIALIADIHGNLAALDAALTKIERVEADQIVCLGDVAAMGPQPREVLARLRRLGCPVVMGNADMELLEPGSMSGSESEQAKFLEITRWTAAQLDDEDVSFIRSFQPTVSIPLEPFADLLCVHGSPRSYNDIILATTPAAELAPMLPLDDDCPAVIAGGHTHVAMLRQYRATTLVNPGSVGRAYQEWHDGRVIVAAVAEFAILSVTENHQSLTFHRAAYDQAATLRAMTEREMPHEDWWAADWQWNLEQP